MPIKYTVCCRCEKVCNPAYHFLFKLCGTCNIIKTIQAREEALEYQEYLVGPVDVDEPDEQFLTMECFEAINYHFLQTSKVSIDFTKVSNIKDI